MDKEYVVQQFAGNRHKYKLELKKIGCAKFNLHNETASCSLMDFTCFLLCSYRFSSFILACATNTFNFLFLRIAHLISICKLLYVFFCLMCSLF